VETGSPVPEGQESISIRENYSTPTSSHKSKGVKAGMSEESISHFCRRKSKKQVQENPKTTAENMKNLFLVAKSWSRHQAKKDQFLRIIMSQISSQTMLNKKFHPIPCLEEIESGAVAPGVNRAVVGRPESPTFLGIDWIGGGK